ncbi:MAG: hypothetical protein WDM90_11845 [Ferruginibacter sp.]
MQNLKIIATTPIKLGDPIQINVPEVGGYRIYSWHGPNNFTSQYTENLVTSTAELKYEGWYYVTVTNNSCGVKADSVFIDVKLLQGTPPCTIATNTAAYSSLLSSDSYTSVKKIIDGSTSLLVLNAYLPDNMKVFFHPAWRTKEPEDGLYTTISTPIFDQFDNNYNKVYITTTKSSIYWGSQPDQTVYISHVGGKLQVRFCNLPMSGSNGTSYTTNASGNLLEN